MDLAILSANIFTGDPKRPRAQAVGIKKNLIVEVGSNEEIKKSCQRGTRVLDIPGRLVTAGFVDAHCHFGLLGLSLQTVDLRDLSSLAAFRERIKQAAVSYQPDEWIIGQGWNQYQWEETREPTRHDLDDIIPRNPAMMVRACGHTVCVNSVALAKAGITRETPDPPGGKIEHDQNGDPTGLLREARLLIERNIPHPTLEDWKNAILLAQQKALHFGLTGVHSLEMLYQWEAMAALEKEGKLKLRVHHALQSGELEKAVSRQITPGQGSERLWFGPVKLFADGSLGSGTALLHEPYVDNPSQYGIAVQGRDELQKDIQRAYEHNWDISIHAIGDKAVTNCLEAIAAAREIYPGERRDSIEHVQLLRPQDRALFRDLGVVASVQPVFLPTDWPVAEKRWGRDRCQSGGYAWKSILNAGIPMQFGSDAPVEPIRPVLGLQAAVTRQTTQGEPPGGWFPKENLTLEESINGFTMIPAWTARKENNLGTVAPGKWADLSIFEQDLFRLPPDQWHTVDVEMTIVDGEIVFQKEKK